MDWGAIVTLLIRVVGWTYAECLAQPAQVVFDLIDDFNEYPPEYMTLAAVYLGEKPKAAEPVDLQEIAPIMGGANPVPEHIREMFRWAQDFGKQQMN